MARPPREVTAASRADISLLPDTMQGVIRRLRLHPQVEIGKENVIAAKLYRNLGFVPWETF